MVPNMSFGLPDVGVRGMLLLVIPVYVGSRWVTEIIFQRDFRRAIEPQETVELCRARSLRILHLIFGQLGYLKKNPSQM